LYLIFPSSDDFLLSTVYWCADRGKRRNPMTRACVSMLLCSVLLAPGAAQAADPSTPSAVSGAYAVHFNVNIASTLPAGAVIVCKARIAPNPQGPGSPAPTDAALAQSATGVTTVSRSTANCAVEIPFSWTVRSTQGGVALSYELQAIDANRSQPVLLRATAPQGIAAAYPSAGGIATLDFNVRF